MFSIHRPWGPFVPYARTRTHTHVLARELTLEGRGCLLYKLKVKLILVHVG